MANGLAALGRASPALSRTWSDIMGENRARRQEAIQGEQWQQQKAISDVTLQREQMALETQKKQEAWLSETIDITTHPTFMGLSPETQNRVKQDFSTQRITDISGRGTRRDIFRQVDMMEKTPKLLDSYLTVEMNARHSDVLKANETLQKEIQKPDANPQKVAQLQAQFDVVNEKYIGLLKNRKDYMDGMEWKANIDAITGEIRRLQSEGKLGQMPEALKQSMFMSLKTGDLKSVNEILKEWAKSELKPVPKTYVKGEVTSKGIPLSIDQTTGTRYAPGGIEYDPKIHGEIPGKGRQPTEAERDPDAHAFSKALEDARKTEQTPLFMEKLSEAEQQRAEARLRQKAKSNYLTRKGNPKKFDQFWKQEVYGAEKMDAADISKLKEFDNPDQAISHVERSFRANMISTEMRDQALTLINQNRKTWGKWRTTP